MKIQGYVQEILAKQTKVGPMYDLRVNGDTYGVGKYAPRDIQQGDYVEFVMEQNGNFRNVGRGTLRKLDAPANSPPASARPQATKVGGGWDERQAVISKQAALNTAISFVDVAIKAGVLPTKDLGLLEQVVFEQASRFHQFSTGEAVDPADFPESAVEKKTRAKKGAKAAESESSDADEWDD